MLGNQRGGWRSDNNYQTKSLPKGGSSCVIKECYSEKFNEIRQYNLELFKAYILMLEKIIPANLIMNDILTHTKQNNLNMQRTFLSYHSRTTFWGPPYEKNTRSNWEICQSKICKSIFEIEVRCNKLFSQLIWSHDFVCLWFMASTKNGQLKNGNMFFLIF